MDRKLYITYVSITTIAFLAAVISFTTLYHSQAHAEADVSAASVRCFIGNKIDRPDNHMTRGWVCVPERTPVVAIN
jgi:hypothetical protein